MLLKRIERCRTSPLFNILLGIREHSILSKISRERIKGTCKILLLRLGKWHHTSSAPSQFGLVLGTYFFIHWVEWSWFCSRRYTLVGIFHFNFLAYQRQYDHKSTTYPIIKRLLHGSQIQVPAQQTSLTDQLNARCWSRRVSMYRILPFFTNDKPAKFNK